MSSRSTSTAIASSSADPEVRVTPRAVARLTALALWSAATISLWAVGAVLAGNSNRPRWRRWIFRGWSRGTLRLLSVQVTRRGVPPETPFVMVANHLSYLDVVLLAAESAPVFVAKQEVRSWPVVGLLARAMETIFIDRNAPRDTLRAIDQVDAALARSNGVAVFAEATSSSGARVLPFRPALLEWAARADYPVHYAALSYATPAGTAPAHLAVCWWGDMSFGPHLVGLAALPSVHASVTFGAAPIRDQDRKRLAARLHRVVEAEFIPVIGDESGESVKHEEVRPLDAIEGNCLLLSQCAELLRQMDDMTYATAGGTAERSAAGTHFRHIFDHYQAFLGGLAGGEIDYDARPRDQRLERDRSLALETALGILSDLRRLPPALADRPLRVSMRSVADAEECDWSGSSVKRELQFLVSHTVHHYAIIKPLLLDGGFDPGESFGVAPSTLAFQRQAACAR